jgi:hypothetical protein
MELALRTWIRIVLVNFAQFALSAYALGLYRHSFGTLEEVESASTESFVMFSCMYSSSFVYLFSC